MKAKSLLPAFLAILFFLPACHDNLSGPVPTTEELLESKTATDSLLYYLGQIRAYQYWKRSDSDTALRSEEQMENFLRGVHDGLRMVKEDDPNYNNGLRIGIRMAETMLKIEEDYDVDLDRHQFLRSLRNGLYDAEAINPLAMQTAYYKILHEFEVEHSESDREATFRSIQSVAEEHGLSPAGNGLWWRLVKEGSGPRIKPGDRVTLQIDYTRVNGESLGMPSPEIQTVGRGSMPEILTDAYCMLQKGSSAIFAASVQQVFGSRGELIGLRPINVIIIHVTVLNVETSPAPLPEFPEDDISVHSDSLMVL